jgi:hypothetical protein
MIFPRQPCVAAMEVSGKAQETTWKRRGIPFLVLCGLRGRELVEWNYY